jgi:hypothetical protein
MRALTFALSQLDTGRGLGHALICADARYASIAWLGAERLDRRFVELGDWRMFLLALSAHQGVVVVIVGREMRLFVAGGSRWK